MKKLCFLVFAVFIFSVSGIQAQGFHLGIKAGTNLSEIPAGHLMMDFNGALWPVHLQN